MHDESKLEKHRAKENERQANFRERSKETFMHNESKLEEYREKENKRQLRCRKNHPTTMSNNTSHPTIPNISGSVNTDNSSKAAMDARTRTALSAYDNRTQE
eukprot:1314262-Ditylum_brightwellii.AAC.1